MSSKDNDAAIDVQTGQIKLEVSGTCARIYLDREFGGEYKVMDFDIRHNAILARRMINTGSAGNEVLTLGKPVTIEPCAEINEHVAGQMVDAVIDYDWVEDYEVVQLKIDEWASHVVDVHQGLRGGELGFEHWVESQF